MAPSIINKISLFFLLIGICYTGGNGIFGNTQENDLTRALREELELLVEKRGVGDYIPDRVKDKFKCKLEGEGCRGLPHCCGKLQCYWSKGFSLLKDGECVQCVKDGELCQRDKQCCENLVCDKASPVDLNGRCSEKRKEGKCHRNKQCVTKCDKKWYNLRGRCI